MRHLRYRNRYIVTPGIKIRFFLLECDREYGKADVCGNRISVHIGFESIRAEVLVIVSVAHPGDIDLLSLVTGMDRKRIREL